MNPEHLKQGDRCVLHDWSGSPTELTFVSREVLAGRGYCIFSDAKGTRCLGDNMVINRIQLKEAAK